MKTYPKLTQLVESRKFSYFIISIILLNAILIGIELTHINPLIYFLQKAFLAIFIIEIFLRWFGKRSAETYIKDWWNWFDIVIVLISLLPQGNPDNVGIYTAFRVIRVFRVLRLFKVFPSMGRMAIVLVKSLSSLFQAIFFLMIFMYVYALIGVILFRNKVHILTLNGGNIDPFGNVGEALFSLFRVTTGEDWTDLRYDLMNVGIDNIWINIYFVSWMVLSALLLLNIIIGAIVNNYENEFNKERSNDLEDKLNSILEKLDHIESKKG